MTQPADSTVSLRSSRSPWPRTVAILVAMLLLASALLKTYSPTEVATLATAYQIPIWLTAAVIQLELIMAIVLLAGVWPRPALHAVTALFLLFSLFSGYRAWLGAESCGCFGPVKVPPLVTTILDILVAAAAAFASRFSISEQGGEATTRFKGNIEALRKKRSEEISTRRGYKR